ncbi:MAG: HAD family phosphatase [Parcubacteria group bacterium]|nr:HAD family phosphatase [Parcubacteria group bacterium]
MKISNGVDKKVIGLDMDGVIVDFSELKQKIAAEHGFFLSREETPSDIVKKIIPRPVLEQIKNTLFVDGPQRFSIPLMWGVESILNELKKKRIPIVLISRRKRPDVAKELLRRHNLWPIHFNNNNVFFVEKKEEKDIVAQKYGVTHFIDDEPSVIAVLHSVPHKILFDPFDIYTNDDFYKRCLGWYEAKDLLL